MASYNAWVVVRTSGVTSGAGAGCVTGESVDSGAAAAVATGDEVSELAGLSVAGDFVSARRETGWAVGATVRVFTTGDAVVVASVDKVGGPVKLEGAPVGVELADRRSDPIKDGDIDGAKVLKWAV